MSSSLRTCGSAGCRSGSGTPGRKSFADPTRWSPLERYEDGFGLRSRYDIGIDVITFECDYPHQDSTWPNTLAYAEKILGDLPEDEVFKIVRGNALDLFGLDPVLDRQTSQ
jgi:hypothetical protein